MTRIIPCLDIRDGKVVKGVNFEHIKEVGDPYTMALDYLNQGADTLVILDINATSEERDTSFKDMEKIAKLEIPTVIGGGIKNLAQVDQLLALGFDQVSIGSAAIKDPEFLDKVIEKYGPEKLIVAIDVANINDTYYVFIHGGKTNTGIEMLDWCRTCEKKGVQEVLMTSKDRDGKKTGYDLEAYRQVSKATNLKLIASGGAGKLEDFLEASKIDQVDGLLAASLFHFGEVKVKTLKEYLSNAK